MMAAPIAFAALFLLAIASRRPADHLGLGRSSRRACRVIATVLLFLSALPLWLGRDQLIPLVQWALLLGVLVPPTGLLSTYLMSKRR